MDKASIYIEKAISSFANGDYSKALGDYCQLSELIGIDSCEEIIKICKFKIDPDYAIDDHTKVSVIIPTFNSQNFIEKSIINVLSQTIDSLEIIIYDDGSNDDTINILDKYEKIYNNIKVIRNPFNIGQGYGRNKAIKIATGQYVTYLDSDDFYKDENFLSDIYNTAILNDYDIVVTPYSRLKNGELKEDIIQAGVLSGHEAAQRFISRDFQTHAPGAKLYKRVLAESSQFVEYGFSQDVIFSLKCFLKAKKVRVLNRYGYIYNNDNTSCWRPQKLTLKHFYSSLRLLAEIIAYRQYLKQRDIVIEIDGFVNSWKKDHVPRINKILKDKDYDLKELKYLINLFDNFSPFYIEAIHNKFNCKIFYDNTPAIPTINCKLYTNYTNEINELFCSSLRINEENQKKSIVIYCRTLSSGGLEKVASQVGNVLSDEYEIVYILDDDKKTDYEYKGRIIKNDLFNPELLEVLEKAFYIFDYRYKDVTKENSLIKYCVQKYANKYIPTIHNTVTVEAYFKKILDYMKTRIDEFPSIICVSQNVKCCFEEIYGKHKNISVIYNPIEFERIEQVQITKNNYGKYIVFAGRINKTEHKGIDILLKAFALSTARNECKLVFLGEGEFEPRVKDIIKKNDLEKDIIKLGFQKNIYPFLKNALFAAMPSRWEGFSVTLIECLACGIPVLTTKTGGAVEVVQHGINGYFCEIDDIESTVSSMDELYKNYRALNINCASSVKWLDIKKFKKQMDKIIAPSDVIKK